MSSQPPGSASGRFGLVETIDRVQGLDRDLALAVAYDNDAHLALTPARDAGRALRDVLDHAPDIARARAVAACLTYDRDPHVALTRTRDMASTADGDVAVADSADLLALLLHLVDALRPRDPGALLAGGQRQRVSRPARWLARMSARLLPAATAGVTPPSTPARWPPSHPAASSHTQHGQLAGHGRCAVA